MGTPDVSSVFEALSLTGAAGAPLHRRLYDELRRAILDGRLGAGARLPSSRALAASLGVSRNTVTTAFAQLLAEGYLEGRIGSGTYVARALPEDLLELRGARTAAIAGPRAHLRLSARGRIVAASRTGTHLRRAPEPHPFRMGQPDLVHFPWAIWSRLWSRRWRRLSPALAGYAGAAGWPPLREAIAAHAQAARGVRCTPEQVVVTAGSQQALDLAARLLLDPGDRVWIEDPGYLGARGVFRAAGATLVPVPVDEQGLLVDEGARRGSDARLVYVTPSHQYPLGVTMGLNRRLALLEWAGRRGAWVIEDDYDSEFRYAGRPIESLQGLDASGRVLYMGTFSKVLFPALRVGYLVVPPELVEAFHAARALEDQGGDAIAQAVLADFIAEGHHARHLRRMRALYAERHDAMVEGTRALADVLEVPTQGGGMTLVGWLPRGLSGETAATAAAAHDLDVVPVSRFALRPLGRGGLCLGYAGLEPARIRDGLVRLRAALAPLAREPRRRGGNA